MAVGVAKSAGFVSAVFLGKVALLPFKSESSPHTLSRYSIQWSSPRQAVYYMGETASYGVKSLQGLSNSEGEKISAGQNDTQVASELEAGQLMREEDILQPASNMICVESSIDDRLTTAIRNLQFEKGKRDDRLCDPGFTKTVLSRFEDICKSSLNRSWIFASPWQFEQQPHILYFQPQN